jgi:hypothetical protein
MGRKKALDVGGEVGQSLSLPHQDQTPQRSEKYETAEIRNEVGKRIMFSWI